MKKIYTLLVKLHVICSRMQRVNLHARPSIIQVGYPTCCYQACALDHAKWGTVDLDYHSLHCRPNVLCGCNIGDSAGGLWKITCSSATNYGSWNLSWDDSGVNIFVNSIWCEFCDSWFSCQFCRCVLLFEFCRVDWRHLVSEIFVSYWVMASPTEPVDLNRASRQEMLSLGWIPMQDVEAIVQQRGPDGILYFSRLMETTSLTRTMLDDLIQRRWVRVHLSDEDFETFETRSNVSSSTSMRDEIEILRKQNRMLRDAMGDQTRVQEEVLSRLVDEMAGRQRPEAATLPSSEVVRPGRLTGVEDLFAGRPSLATAGLDVGKESLMWDDMEQPRPSAAQRRLTNPFLTPLEVRPLLDESLSSDGYVPQGFTRMGNQTVAQQP